MFGWDIGFDRPWFLLLLGLLPVLWVFSFKSLAGLGPWRRVFALMLRTCVLLLFIIALAEIQVLRTSDKLAVVYVLDQSESIPPLGREAMRQYVIEEVAKHRNRDREDLAGVIVFGAIAKVDNPPIDDNIIRVGESILERTDATNLAEALKLAQALFTDDAAKRIVIVSDGNENLGDARAVAQGLSRNGIGIDVVPVSLPPRADIAVEKISLPADLRKGQKFEARVVINNFADPTSDQAGVVPGKLRLIEHSSNGDRVLRSADVKLESGKNVFSFQHEINRNAMFTYEAEFTPEDVTQDLTLKNNKATAYTHVRGAGHVLLIEDSDPEFKGEFDSLVKKLEEQKLQVTVIDTSRLFDAPADLLEYDTIVLANVPRSSGNTADDIAHFSDEQIHQLVRNTEQMGCGLVMIGGPNSFGAGGWSNTELEKAMPVDFQIKNAKVRAVGALVLLMHASEMADGNHWQKVVAKESIQALGPADYCGLIHWGIQGDEWLWTKGGQGIIRVGDMRNTMLARLDNMTPGDMPQFDPAMRMAFNGLRNVPASVKHMIIISDGDPSRPLLGTVQRFANDGIKISTVAVGAHGQVGHQTLKDIATDTAGKYYEVTNPKALPRIYQLEARRVARPLIFDPPNGTVQPKVVGWNQILEGIDSSSLQPLRAYVSTTRKENPLVEQLIIADQPDDDGKNSTILASWNYGLGRTIAFTSDAGKRWADKWQAAEYYEKFFSQMVRYSMRPIDKEGKFSVATRIDDGNVNIVVTALNPDDEFLNSLDMSAHLLDPDQQSSNVKLKQVGPGRYVGQFATGKPGSYLINVVPGPGYQTVKTGVNVPYSSEFRERETNIRLLTSLASLTPKGGQAGAVVPGELDSNALDELLQFNTFRHTLAKAVSIQDAWPLFIVIAAVLFLADVFVRRVAIGFEWLAPAMAWVGAKVFRRRVEQATGDDRLERLRSQKAEIGQRIDDRRAATRFEPQSESTPRPAPAARPLDQLLDTPAARQRPASPSTAASLAPEETARDESYTSRLLEAKKKALKKKPE